MKQLFSVRHPARKASAHLIFFLIHCTGKSVCKQDVAMIISSSWSLTSSENSQAPDEAIAEQGLKHPQGVQVPQSVLSPLLFPLLQLPFGAIPRP